MAGSESRGKRGRKHLTGEQGLTTTNRSLSPTENGVRAEARLPRIELGEYDAICYGFDVATSGFDGQRKCYLKFRVYGGKYDGTELFMACTYPKGRIGRRLKLMLQWMLAMQRRPHPKERISPKSFLNRMYTVMVSDTKCKYPGTNRLLPDYCQYSVVKTIIEAQTGVPGGH